MREKGTAAPAHVLNLRIMYIMLNSVHKRQRHAWPAHGYHGNFETESCVGERGSPAGLSDSLSMRRTGQQPQPRSYDIFTRLTHHAIPKSLKICAEYSRVSNG